MATRKSAPKAQPSTPAAQEVVRTKSKVNQPHPDYAAGHAQWTRCSDAFEGSDAVKGAGVKYLPVLADQKIDDYNAYKMRALFYGATERTVQGLSGAAVAKPFKVELPSAIEYMESKATADELSLQQFTKKIVVELLKVGRCGILADRMPALGDADVSGVHLGLYQAHQILNWRLDPATGKLDRVVLEECFYDADPLDEYKQVERKQWRELRLVNKVYSQILWRKAVDTQGREIDEAFDGTVIAITKRGQALDEIPFSIANAGGVGTAINKPPLLSMVDVNLSHYRNSADLEHGRHFTGLPTPWVSGVTLKPGDKLQIGSATAWVFKDAGAQCGYLEFTGQGLATLEKALETKEKMMAVLGARLLDNQKAVAEAEGTLRIRNMSDTFTLAGVNIAAADALCAVLDFAAHWEGVEESAETLIEPNTSFTDTTLSAQDLTALLGAFNAGAISLETFLWNLERGERLPPGIDAESEAAKIEESKDKSPSSLPLLSPTSQE